MVDGSEVRPGEQEAASEGFQQPRPTFDRRSENEALLDTDETVLGRLFAYDREQLSTNAISRRRGCRAKAGFPATGASYASSRSARSPTVRPLRSKVPDECARGCGARSSAPSDPARQCLRQEEDCAASGRLSAA